MTHEPRPAFVSVGELFGGVERHLLGMCTWMHRQGREPLLILFHDQELARQARDIGVEPIILETSGSFDLHAPKRLAQILADRQINVVHAHGYRAMVNVAMARRAHEFGAVRTVHGLVEGERWFSPGTIKGKLYTRMEQVAARSTRATVCYVTRDLQNAYSRADHGLEARTVYNGIDPLTENDYSRPQDLDVEAFNFGAVGRVSAVKGLEYALEAMDRLDPGIKVVLNIIGTGPLVDSLRASSQARGLSDRVRFLGFKDNVYDYLAHLDTLLMPSIHEGLPYTILEALSLGTPILASRTGGLAEILQDRETALLMDVGDVESLAQAMTELSTDRDLAQGLVRAGKKVQREKFTLETMGNQYWREYEQVMK